MYCPYFTYRLSPHDSHLLSYIHIYIYIYIYISRSGGVIAGALFVRQVTDGSGDISDGQGTERRQRAAGWHGCECWRRGISCSGMNSSDLVIEETV